MGMAQASILLCVKDIHRRRLKETESLDEREQGRKLRGEND